MFLDCWKFCGCTLQDRGHRDASVQGPYSIVNSMSWLNRIALLFLGVLLAERVNCQHVKNNVPRLKLSYKEFLEKLWN
ncbi:unnamed protein product [Natator depressus]